MEQLKLTGILKEFYEQFYVHNCITDEINQLSEIYNLSKFTKEMTCMNISKSNKEAYYIC